MFRPTHFVILLAVFLCAYAAPAAEPSPAVEAINPSPQQSAPVIAEGDAKADKSDLETDATVYFRGYVGPRWGYYGPGWGARWGLRTSIGWGPYSYWY